MGLSSTRQFVRSFLEPIVIVLIGLVLIFLIYWNLGGYPVTSGFDEGIYLQFSQNLSHYGVYGTSNGGNYDILVPQGGTGPILIGSVVLSFKLLGQSLYSARFAVTIFLILSIIGLYLLIRETSNWQIASIGLLIYLVAGVDFYDTLWMGRQVLGEVPSQAFLFLGLWCLIKVLKKYSRLLLFASLILLGLAVVAKNQLVWILIPALAAMAVGDFLIWKKNHWKIFIVAASAVLISFLAWYVAQILMTGNSASYQEIASYNLLSGYLRFSISKIIANINLLRYSGFLLPIAISCLYAIFRIFRDKAHIYEAQALLFSLAAFGLFSSVVLSLPWARYIYSGIVFTIPILAWLLNDSIHWIRSKGRFILRLGLAACIVVFVGFLAFRLFSDAKLIVQTNNNDAQQFATLVDNKVPAGSEVLNWEWEIEFYSHSDFIHPNYMLFPALIDHTYNKIDSPILQNPRIPVGVHYLITGPFSSQNGVFTEEMSQRETTSLGQVGDYSLIYLR